MTSADQLPLCHVCDVVWCAVRCVRSVAVCCGALWCVAVRCVYAVCCACGVVCVWCVVCGVCDVRCAVCDVRCAVCCDVLLCVRWVLF